jgi:hypothetical protein
MWAGSGLYWSAMGANRYEALGGEASYEDQRRQRQRDYLPIEQSPNYRIDCQYVVETLKEMIDFDRLAEEWGLGPEDRVEVSTREVLSDNSSVQRLVARRQSRTGDGSQYYTVARHVMEGDRRLYVRSFGITEHAEHHNIVMQEMPKSTAKRPWLRDVLLAGGHSGLLDFDFGDLVDELEIIDNQLNRDQDYYG